MVRYGYHLLLTIGVIFTLIGASFLLAASYWQWHSLTSMIVGLFITVAPVSFVSSNSNIGLLNLFPKNAGAANAVFGVAQFGIGAAATFWIGILFTGTELAMAQVMWCTAMGSCIAALWLLLSKR